MRLFDDDDGRILEICPLVKRIVSLGDDRDDVWLATGQPTAGSIFRHRNRASTKTSGGLTAPELSYPRGNPRSPVLRDMYPRCYGIPQPSINPKISAVLVPQNA